MMTTMTTTVAHFRCLSEYFLNWLVEVMIGDCARLLNQLPLQALDSDIGRKFASIRKLL